MEHSEEWKSVFPISSSTAPRLLLRSTPFCSVEVGPLLFHPVPNSLSSLFSSHSLSPPILNPPPQLSYSRFLQTTTYPDCPILRSTSVAVASAFGSPCDDDPTDFRHNRLETLRCPKGQIITLFPTGSNLDQVGFVVLSVRDSELRVSLDSEGNIFMSPQRFNHRIVQLCASPVGYDDHDSDGVEGLVNVGYLVACTLYSVHWFCLRIRGLDSDCEKPVLGFLGSKLFNKCAVAHACWNPHSSNECLVLLENGDLFLFYISSDSSSWNSNGLGGKFRGSRLCVPWEELGQTTTSGWFSCAFSWHPRILILANSSAVFLVDLRHDKYDVTCLLKIGETGIEDTVGSDRFIVFAKGMHDEFHFAVASQHWVYLCDIRKPSMAVLQWAHHLQEPCYMIVSPLSDLKSNSILDERDQYSERSFAIILGSFWNCNFSLFCGGPQPSPGQNSFDELSDKAESIYAWENQSHFSFSGQDCLCGTCLLRDNLAKGHIPEWIQWQQKKELVMGFYILDRDLFSQVSEPDEYGGFTLVRMMSCGKLESQRYSVTFNMPRTVDCSRTELPLHCRDPLMYFTDDEKYRFPRKFKYMKLEYLYRNLNGTLTNTMFKRLEKIPTTVGDEQHSCVLSHQFLCKNSRASGFKRPKERNSIDVFKNVGMPASIYEVTSEKMWAGLPVSILEFAFSNYKEILEVLLDQKKVSLDFLAVPDQIQLPPFLLRNPSYRANKWSRGVHSGDDVVGPAVPLPALLALKEINENGSSYLNKVREFSFEREMSQQSETVMQIAESMAVKQSGDKALDKDVVFNEREQTWVASEDTFPYFSYKLCAFSVEQPDVVTMQKDPVNEERRSSFMVAKLSDHERSDCHDDKIAGKFNQDGMELFADLCPVDLMFDNPDPSFGPKELKVFQKLKKQFSKWQNGFSPYMEFRAQVKRQKHYP